jgi:hypothetical protein
MQAVKPKTAADLAFRKMERLETLKRLEELNVGP